MSISKILISKNVSINFIIANEPINNTKPTKALVIRAFADSTCALSPPDKIQLTAPHRNMKKKASPPKTYNQPTNFGNNCDINSEPPFDWAKRLE